MESESHRDIFDENLKRLLEASWQEDSGFQAHLLDVVRREVRKERSAIRKRWILRSVISVTSAAALIAIAWSAVGLRPRKVGQFQPIYGMAELVNAGKSKAISGGELIRTGSLVSTLSGSRAAILLTDGSKLTLAPRTTVKMSDGRQGPVVELETGAVDVQAAKQQAGRRLVVQTPGSRVTTLGTVFTVQLSTKADGTRKTRVGVASGLVEFESGGRKVQLPARTEGIAEEGQSPEKRLVRFELNEMLRLIRGTSELASELNKKAGSPAIIQCRDGSTAAIWTVIRLNGFRETEGGARTLQLKSPAAGAKLFTLEGREILSEAEGRNLLVKASALGSGASQETQLILELRDVKGVFQTDEGGTTRLSLPAGPSDAVTLLQFHLPNEAKIEHIWPEPVERTRVLNRLAITVAAEIEGLEVSE